MTGLRRLLGRALPASLFARVLLTLVGTFGLFAVATFFLIVYFALYPLAQRSAADLAGIMLLSARTLVQLPPELREGYRQRLAEDYELRFSEVRPVADSTPYFFPFIDPLETALMERLGRPVEAVASRIDAEQWFWVALDAGDRVIWTGFPRQRLRTRPVEGLVAIAVLALLLILASATLLARRISQPLHRLCAVAAEVARGRSPNALPETGPTELKSLALQFNEMSRQVRDLLANRTVLLAGISHDLRTPLTRLRLAIAMLPENAPVDLIARMERDIEEMNALIGQSVDFACNPGIGNPEELELGQLIGDLVADRPRAVWQCRTSCRWRVDGLALRRILGNLMENALRYSRDAVEVRLDCVEGVPVISISDRGPGIPESEREAVFRPYYRLERSRSRQTGGSGLGLAIARQLAEANRFELRLEARRGGGTVAQVRLPPIDPGLGSDPVSGPSSSSDSQLDPLAAPHAVDGQAGAA